jgi:flagellin
MGLRINSNNQSIANKLSSSQNRMKKTLERLASGNRINRAADDAAGLAIAEGFRSQVRGAQVETQNLQSGISMVQTAEGGLEQTTGALQRIRELALQASSGTLTDAQRGIINDEAQQMVAQIEDTAQDTEFNEISVLSGAGGTVDLGAGTNVAVDLPDATSAGLGVAGLDLSTQAGAQAAIAAVDTAIGTVNAQRAELGATQNAISSAIRTREVETENLMAAQAAIREADIAVETTRLAQAQILQQGGIAMLAQGNVASQNALRLLGG